MSHKKINYTISNDDIEIKPRDFTSNKSKSKSQNLKADLLVLTNLPGILKNATSTTSLNSQKVLLDTALVGDDALNDARWFDHDIDIDENLDLDENINDRQIIDLDLDDEDEDPEDQDQENEEDEESNSSSSSSSGSSQLSATKSAPSQSPSRIAQITAELSNSIGQQRQLSLSLSNLPESLKGEMNQDDDLDSKSHMETKLDTTVELVAKNWDIEHGAEAMFGIKTSNTPSTVTTSQAVIEQQNLITFEPFEFKLPSDRLTGHPNHKSDFEYILDQENHEPLTLALPAITTDDTLLQNVLRRQSLFKLKEKINGKVSKQINEIEQRKLSPYRFSNSPLKKRAVSSKSSDHAGSSKSPIRVPSIFCKRILADHPNEGYNVKTSKRSSDKLSKTIGSSSVSSSSMSSEPKLPADTNSSPMLVRAANHFYKKLNRNRSIKRLNVTMSSGGGGGGGSSSSSASVVVSQAPPLASIQENEAHTPFMGVLKPLDVNKLIAASQSMVNNSPMSKQLLNINEWKCSSESIDL
jgi:hypothetical protein